MANDITINIGANNKASKVLDKVSRDVKGFAGRVKAATTSLQGMFSIFAGAAAATAALRSITFEMERIDRVAKTSRKLGLLTEDLIGLRLAAAEFSGMADQQLDIALQRMTRRLSEAADKTKTASLTLDGSVVQLSGVRKAIDDMGLSAERLNSIGPADAFREIADAIQGVKNPADQLRIAFTLFDSEGASLVNTLSQGSSAIDEMNERAKALGLTFTDLEANRIEAANDSIHEMTAAWSGLRQELAIGLAPALRDTSSLLTEITKQSGPFFGSVQEFVKRLVVSELDFRLKASGQPGMAPVIGDSRTTTNTAGSRLSAALASLPGAAGFAGSLLSGSFPNSTRQTNRQDPIENFLNEATGEPERQRLDAIKNDLKKESERRQKSGEEFDAILSGVVADVTSEQRFTTMANILKEKLAPSLRFFEVFGDSLVSQASLGLHRFMNPNSSGEMAETDQAESKRKQLDKTSEEFKLFAKQSRVLGSSSDRRNEVVGAIEKDHKLRKEETDKLAKAFDASAVKIVSGIAEFFPEFKTLTAEFIQP